MGGTVQQGVDQPAAGARDASLRELRTDRSGPDVIAKLDEAARRGKLAGFKATGAATFEVEAFAVPFEHALVGTVFGVGPGGAEGSGGGGSVVRFEQRMLPRMPLVWLVILLVTIWPGLPLTELLIDQIFPAMWWTYTWYWYLPLTIASLPLTMWWGFKKSRAMARESATEMLSKIEGTLKR
ncbi:MAG: hypothetical protein K2X32_03490 [Phycisphaerales bacterium]|nr:hypothetical protein [Phycisphaerales bacterium]